MTNPILTELSSLSPGAQQALVQAHTAMQAKPEPPPTPSLSGGMTSPPPSLQAPAAPHAITAPAPKMPLGTEQGDQAERTRLISSGSGINQIHNPVLKGLAGVGNAIGSIVAPGLMREIPGTEEHHEQLLGRTNKNLEGDVNLGQKEAQTTNLGATTAYTQAKTAGLPQQDTDKHNLSVAQAGNLTSETEHRGDVKDSWKELAGYTGPNGEPLEINQATGETRAAKAPTGSHISTPAKEVNPQQQTYDSLLKQGMTPMQAYEKIREKPGGTTINQGTWALDEDPTTGKPVLFNSKTGETKAAPTGVAKSGTFAKGQAAAEPAKQALSYAESYGNGIHTGPGDEALMEKFFELAKPSTGFRMSQPQIDMLKNARDWAGGIEGHIRHAATGTWFSDEQRKEIIGTMHDLAKAKGIDGGAQGGTIRALDPQGVLHEAPAGTALPAGWKAQ